MQARHANGAAPRPRTGLRQRLFAWMQGQSSSPTFERILDPYKRRLLGDLSGTVVELGPGMGGNFAFYPRTVEWVGIEPNVFTHETLREQARAYGFEPDIRSYEAERLPLEVASADAVVATHMLCSVRDQAAVLAEVLRVLKPGGKFVFIEHVAAPENTGARQLQHLVQPVWGFVGDGCHVTRDTEAAIRSAGFAAAEIDTFTVPVPIAGPHIAGSAVKG